MNLAERAAATQATWNTYRGVPHCWRGTTCIHVMREHLVLFGHDIIPVPEFNTKKGAREAMEAMGASSLSELLPILGLAEILPSEMIVGDIAILPGDAGRTDGIRGAVAIYAGQKFMGWHGAAEGFCDIDDVMPHVTAAFRV